MKKLVKDVGVDAGMILICDLDYYKKYEEEPFIDNKISKAFIIKNGTYKTDWEIPKTWDGPIDGSGIIRITSSVIVVSDPCYVLKDGWDKWLEVTNFGLYADDNTILINSMGGDGNYDVHLNIERVKEL